MDKEILECALKRNWKEETLEKVISVETESGFGQFEHFLSTSHRINLKVILKNGRTVKKSLFMKTAPTNESIAEFNEKNNIFKIEIVMYGMLKEIEYIMEEFEDSDDALWCQMVYHVPYTCIVLEDLKAKGFYMLGKKDLYDLEHSMLSIHALGKYHGMCKKLEERGILSPQGFNPWYIFLEEMHPIMYRDVVGLVEGIKKVWDPIWTPIVDKIKISKESFSQRLKKLGELDETKFNLLNHGDPHKNNFLFKYASDKRPISIKFLDFQMVHYGSPCLDLIYLLYLAFQPSVRRNNFDLLIRTYHNSLINTLDKYQFKGNKPNIEEIFDGMEKYSFIGYLLFLTRYPNLLAIENWAELHDNEKIEATDGKEGYSDELFKTEQLVDDMGPDIKAFSKMFL